MTNANASLLVIAARVAFLISIGFLIAVVLITAPIAPLPSDSAGVLRFRTSWVTPPTCVVHATDDALYYICLGH